MSAPATISHLETARGLVARLQEGRGPWPIWFGSSWAWLVSDDHPETWCPKVGGIVTINSQVYRVAARRDSRFVSADIALVPARGWPGWWAFWKTRLASARDELGYSLQRIGDALRGER